MKRIRFSIILIALGTMVGVVPRGQAADAEVQAGRDLVKKYADAIIGVELVVTVKVKMGDREMPPREQKVEINGTVLTKSGLTVTSLAEVDPQIAFEAMQANPQRGGRPELLGADFKEVKLRLADGTEVPARFVLKDADLDLAFMAPEESADGSTRAFTHVDLENAVEGELLERYFIVSRAPKVLQRVPMVRATAVMGMIERPRRLYLATEHALGAPMFDAEGRVLGISLQHFANSRRTGVVVLPAADIAEVAKQAEAALGTATGEAAAGK